MPFNKAYCNFILNVAPNRDGLIDANALAALKDIGSRWKPAGPVDRLPEFSAPIISSNLAKRRPAYSSWSDDMWIMDFANDDSFTTSWTSNPTVKKPWLEVELDGEQAVNMITLYERNPHIKSYTLEYSLGRRVENAVLRHYTRQSKNPSF